MPKVVAEAITKAVGDLLRLIEEDESNQDEITSISVNRYGRKDSWFIYVTLQKTNPPKKSYGYKYVMHVDAKTGHIEEGDLNEYAENV